MKGKSVLTAVAALVMISAGPVLADYDSIQHNLIDGTGDTTYVGGVLTVSAMNDNLTLNDGGSALPGAVTNCTVLMTATYVPGSYDPVAMSGDFTGGSYLLTFDYDGTPHQLGGPIHAMVLTIEAGPLLSKISGQGLWSATNPDPPSLPGSNLWPDGNDPINNPLQLSSIQSLTLAFGMDLSLFNWDEDLGTSALNPAETLYNLFPDDRAVPEPVSVLLLGLGSLVLVRRRRV